MLIINVCESKNFLYVMKGYSHSRRFGNNDLICSYVSKCNVFEKCVYRTLKTQYSINIKLITLHYQQSVSTLPTDNTILLICTAF
jgi:hypothetical protein